MSFLTDEEKDTLTIGRMIFHVVGKSLEEPILLNEITPPQHADFFIERVKSALKGNLFEFRERSNMERILRLIELNPENFTNLTQELASDFQSRHGSTTSTGVFFVFELIVARGSTIFALVKYDNEDVVRYVLRNGGNPQVPELERFRESFVRKPEAMQKIALVRLSEEGGRIMVRDRSNTAHISAYFEGFLQARRVNSADDLSEKLTEAFKQTFKEHRSSLPQDVRRSGVNRIYEVMRQGGHRFDPDDFEPLLTAIFGQVAEDAPLRRTLRRKLREQGVSEETFDINPEKIQRPRRYRIETEEGTEIIFDEAHRPEIRPLADGRQEVVVVTADFTRDDVDIEQSPRRR